VDFVADGGFLLIIHTGFRKFWWISWISVFRPTAFAVPGSPLYTNLPLLRSVSVISHTMGPSSFSQTPLATKIVLKKKVGVSKKLILPALSTLR